VLAFWPYPVNKNASIAEMQALAYDLFFSHGSIEDLEKAEVKDSMRNGCFGVAQDLQIRVRDWGFRLCDVQGRVTMRHSKSDDVVPFITAEMTAKLLPHCQLETRENDVHFSQHVLDDFLDTIINSTRRHKSLYDYPA
jgi:hypothetical protein